MQSLIDNFAHNLCHIIVEDVSVLCFQHHRDIIVSTFILTPQDQTGACRSGSAGLSPYDRNAFRRLAFTV